MKRYRFVNRLKIWVPALLLILLILVPVGATGQSRIQSAGGTGLVSIPVKWAGIDGSPSIVDPARVGEPTVKDVLWRRHERISDFRLIPTCNVTLRSAAIAAIANFPIIADPQAVGNPGDINLGPTADDFTEFFDAIDAARNAWIALGVAGDFGITVVSMNRFVDDTGTANNVLGLGGFSSTQCDAALQAVIGRAMVIDPAYLRPNAIMPSLQVFNDVNERILGQELLHGLTLDHVPDANNLMAAFFSNDPNPGNLTNAQCDVIRNQSTAHVPGTMVDPVPEPLLDLRADRRNDVEDRVIDIHLAGIARETALKQTHFFLSTTGMFPRAEAQELGYFFMLDADNNGDTGGAPGGLGIPTDAKGIELVGRLLLSKASQSDSLKIVVEFFRFQQGNFVPIIDRRIIGLVHPDSVSVLTTKGAFNYGVGEIISLRVPDEFVGDIATVARFLVVTNNLRRQTLDRTDDLLLTFRNPVFPTCTVEPNTIENGGTVVLQAQGLPPNQRAHVILGDTQVAEGQIDAQGNLKLELKLAISDSVATRAHLLTVGTDETAITADCIVTILTQGREVFVFGRKHTTRGNARIQLMDSKLLVSNLGSGGEDGVDIELGGVRNFDIDIDPLSLKANGASVKLTASGIFNGQPNVLLGSAELRNDNGPIQAFVDFRSIGASNARIAVYNNGVYIGETTVPSGGLIGSIIIDDPILGGCGKLPPFRPIPLPCYYFDWFRRFTFTATNGVVLQGTQIRILAADATGEINSLSSFGVSAANIPSFAIAHEALPGEPITQSVPVKAGWNLNSLAAQTDVLNLKELFPNANTGYGFVPSEGYKLIDHFQPNYGYWVNVQADATSLMEGNAINEYTVLLPEGWSIIGGLSRVAADPQPEPSIPLTMYRFIPGVGYQLTDQVPPGEGVWINSSQPIALTVSPAQGLALSQSTSATSKEATIRATGEIVGTRINVSNVVVGWDDAGANTALAPPSPPEYTTQLRLFRLGDFTNAYARDIRALQNNQPETWVLEVDPNGNTPPSRTTVVSWDANEITALGNNPWVLREGTTGSGTILVADMRSTTSFMVTGTGEQYFTIGGIITEVEERGEKQGIPDRFSLYQNYPNPFNPETEIRYDLPKASRVTLTIYNLAGQMVQTLVDGTIPAGSHTVHWNGRDTFGRRMASGIYFYRLRAGEFVQTRKMILLP